MTARSPDAAATTAELERASCGAGRIQKSPGDARSALAVLLLVPALSVCGGGPPAATQPPAPPPSDAAELTVAVDPQAALLANQVSKGRAILTEADAMLAQGEIEPAIPMYEQIFGLDLAGDVYAKRELQLRALLGVAQANLQANPSRPVHITAAKTALQTVIASYDGSLEATYARWILTTLEEVERLRALGRDKDATIRQLNETVDQLRKIDSNRRPNGSPSP
jgi:hypothetical protein